MGTINDRLEILREHLELKQADFAEIIGIKQPTYSQILKGKSNLTTAHLQRLHEYAGVSPLWILTGEGEMIIAKSNNSTKAASTKPGPSFEDVDRLYQYVIGKRNVELSTIQALKFKTACARCYLDNPGLKSLEELAIAANTYLNFILRFPDIEI